MRIPYNKPFVTGGEVDAITDAIKRGHLSSDGEYTARCERLLDEMFASRTMLTTSCTAALEIMAQLLDLEDGDEIVMPSFTFVTSASAFVSRGARPVFVDIEPRTLNLDPDKVEAAITPRTRAILAVHYAGVACDMPRLQEIAKRHGIPLLEDAAHCLNARYNDRELGTFGALGALSFHETKNIIAGEGGAVLVNDDALVERAEIVRQKGTNRKAFLAGAVDKYTWVDIGASFAPSELIAAFLYPQLLECERITSDRVDIWNKYHELLQPLEQEGLLRRPDVPDACTHNAHIYHVLLHHKYDRAEVLNTLQSQGIGAIFHYIPLHSSPAGQKFGRTEGTMAVTDDVAARIVRLPLWVGMTDAMIESVSGTLASVLR